MRKADDEEYLEALTAEAELAATGKRKPTRQSIPVRIVENLQLSLVTPAAIRRRLRGEQTQAGPIVSLEWYLLDYDASAALYEAACPYEFCNGKGNLMAATTIDKRGFAVLPFDSPGSLCCDRCDSEIEARYEQEAEKLRNPRKRASSLITAENPKACECGQALPVCSPANKRLCQPCATARALDRKRVGMAAKRAGTVAVDE